MYSAGKVTLLAAGGVIAGDSNRDGGVDTVDFGTLKDHFSVVGSLRLPLPHRRCPGPFRIQEQRQQRIAVQLSGEFKPRTPSKMVGQGRVLDRPVQLRQRRSAGRSNG